ncbi:hypothetical protein SLA2020_203850 [Shorea laevis]
MAETKKSHVAILPSPGMDHLIPLVELGKRLVRLHNISVTFIIPTNEPPSKAQKSIFDSLPASVDHVFLPPVNLSDVPNDAKIETLISLTIIRSLPFIREVLNSLVESTLIVALVVDHFGTNAFDLATKFKISPTIFFPTTAMALSLFHELPRLDETVSSEYRDLLEPVKIPGCKPVRGKELLDPLQDRKNDAYKWILHHAKRYRLADGIMVNSFKDLEAGAIKALKEQGKLVYPIGPLVIKDPSPIEDEAGCLMWLDDQPHGSVLFVSIGSGWTQSYEQIIELALGLELSAQRFLWSVTRSFSENSQRDPFDFLPDGFLERTEGRGMVVLGKPSWATQAQILSHGSTGGFFMDCGWNSTLESVVNGAPIIAWPLHAEQKMNALMLTEDIKVALNPKANENGLVPRDEIARAVKGFMEGEEGRRVRYRMNDMKEAAAKVLSQDGSSTKALAEVVRKWQNYLNLRL